MATFANPIAQFASLTEGEHVSRTTYSRDSAAVLTQPYEVIVTLQAQSSTTYPIAVQARMIRQSPLPATLATKIPAWIKAIVESLAECMELPPNWDSYGALPVQRALVDRALDVLPRVMGEDSPPPSIVPLSDGGLQMEWHLKGRDLEIIVAADEPPTYYYRSAGGDPKEGLVSIAYEQLRSLIQDLS